MEVFREPFGVQIVELKLVLKQIFELLVDGVGSLLSSPTKAFRYLSSVLPPIIMVAKRSLARSTAFRSYTHLRLDSNILRAKLF